MYSELISASVEIYPTRGWGLGERSVIELRMCAWDTVGRFGPLWRLRCTRIVLYAAER
jgi:hypothetical protein